jgi:hypothetical protein
MRAFSNTFSNTICTVVFAVASLTTGLAHAQVGGRMDSIIEKRFNAANTTHDGKLTKEQAEAGMPRVAKNFDTIDSDHKGYVTLQQVKDAMKEAEASKK